MYRYKIWDKKEDIYTPSGSKFTAEEWMEKFQWLKLPDAKAVIGYGVINGGITEEFESFKARYIDMGLVLEDGLSDDEVLRKIEEFEDAMNNPPDNSYGNKEFFPFENTSVVYISEQNHTAGDVPVLFVYFGDDKQKTKCDNFSAHVDEIGNITITFDRPETGKVVVL